MSNFLPATVRAFDPATRTGEVLLDNGAVIGFTAAAFEPSGLRLLRSGQRVHLELDESGAVRRLALPTA